LKKSAVAGPSAWNNLPDSITDHHAHSNNISRLIYSVYHFKQLRNNTLFYDCKASYTVSQKNGPTLQRYSSKWYG